MKALKPGAGSSRRSGEDADKLNVAGATVTPVTRPAAQQSQDDGKLNAGTIVTHPRSFLNSRPSPSRARSTSHQAKVDVKSPTAGPSAEGLRAAGAGATTAHSKPAAAKPSRGQGVQVVRAPGVKAAAAPTATSPKVRGPVGPPLSQPNQRTAAFPSLAAKGGSGGVRPLAAGAGAVQVAAAGPSHSKGAGPAPSKAAVRPEHHVSKAAVSLAFLQRFADKHKLRKRGLTTAQVVSEIILPATQANRCRYTDVMAQDQLLEVRAAVSHGRRFYFVSHPWSRKFSDTLGMLVRHFEPGRQRVWRRDGDGRPLPFLEPERAFLWLDIFAINQHQLAESQSGSSDLGALCEAVQDAEQTLMVLDPEGTALSRIWCLYEAWQTSRAGKGKLRLLSYGISRGPLERLFLDSDAAQARASCEADRDRILDRIRADVGGLDGMNRALKEALVAGVVEQMEPNDVSLWVNSETIEFRDALARLG